jgi:hypothetical protein
VRHVDRPVVDAGHRCTSRQPLRSAMILLGKRKGTFDLDLPLLPALQHTDGRRPDAFIASAVAEGVGRGTSTHDRLYPLSEPLVAPGCSCSAKICRGIALLTALTRKPASGSALDSPSQRCDRYPPYRSASTESRILCYRAEKRIAPGRPIR